MAEVFITLAIHTYDYAVGLRSLLEEHGIKAVLENVDLENNTVSSGVRVRIPTTDLPLALKVVESVHEHAYALASMGLEGAGHHVLIPVDFSPYSVLAIRTGFAFARMLGINVKLLHVYATPYFDGNLGKSDAFSIELNDAQVRKELEDAAKLEMRRCVGKIRKAIIDGKLPAVKFSTILLEGVPEDAIQQYVRNNPPMLMVMATRGTARKASQMIGSVTAEVIDTCRLPIFTVPENFTFTSFEDMREVVFFCNVDQQDLLAMDVLMRLMDTLRLNVHLIPVGDRAGNKLQGRFEALLDYFREHYPSQRFIGEIIPKHSFRSQFEKYIEEKGISLIAVPNRKKNAFSRLFNPGIAHKILFERDIPLLALPI